MMSGVGVSSSMGGHVPSSPSAIGGVSFNYSLPSISGIGYCTTIPSTFGFSIWGMTLVTSFPTMGFPSVSFPIDYIPFPTYIFIFNGGKGFFLLLEEYFPLLLVSQ